MNSIKNVATTAFSIVTFIALMVDATVARKVSEIQVKLESRKQARRVAAKRSAR